MAADRRPSATEADAVATFYRRLMFELDQLNLTVRIFAKPNEIPDPLPFAPDETLLERPPA